MRLFTLDISKANTGWATLTPKRVECGSFRPTGDTDGKLFASFRKFVFESIDKYFDTPEPVTAVAIERIMPGGTSKRVPVAKNDMIGGFEIKNTTNFETQLALYGLRAVALEVIEVFGLPVFMPTVSVWRKSFLGFSHAPRSMAFKNDYQRAKWIKERTIEACQQLNIHVPNHDAADAVGIAIWLRARLQQERFRQASLL